MELNRRVLFVVLLCSLWVVSNSQEMLGVVNSNYAGSNSILINPGALVNSKLYSDANILTFGAFANSNYLYIHKEDYKPFSFLKPDATFPEYGEDKQSFDYFRDKNLKRFYSNVRLIGPSGFIMINDYAIGLQTQVRTVASGYRIPYDVANFGYHGLDFSEQYDINYNDFDFTFGAMSWGEINLTFAKTVYHHGYDKWTVGGTAKYLMGYASGYADATNLDYIIYDDSTANFINADVMAAVALPVDPQTNDFPYGKTFKGSGLGLDLGVTFVKTRKGYQNQKNLRICEQAYYDYYYKIGFSLLDIGGIKFTDNAQLHQFDNVGHFWERIDTVSFSSVDVLTSELSERFYGDPERSLIAEEFNMRLPAAFSMQVDYKHDQNWYLNGTLVLPVLSGKNYLVRPAIIAVTPRYESPFMEFSFPVSLYDFSNLRLGLSARFWFFTIGTDKLGSFFGLSNFTGADIYFSVKLNLRKGWCGFGKKFKGCYGNEYGRYRR